MTQQQDINSQYAPIYNCITEELQLNNTRKMQMVANNNEYESKHSYIVIPIYKEDGKTIIGRKYKAIKANTIVPEGSTIHTGKI